MMNFMELYCGVVVAVVVVAVVDVVKSLMLYVVVE